MKTITCPYCSGKLPPKLSAVQHHLEACPAYEREIMTVDDILAAAFAMRSSPTMDPGCKQ